MTDPWHRLLGAPDRSSHAPQAAHPPIRGQRDIFSGQGVLHLSFVICHLSFRIEPAPDCG
jgi:hypothetical protein